MKNLLLNLVAVALFFSFSVKAENQSREVTVPGPENCYHLMVSAIDWEPVKGFLNQTTVDGRTYSAVYRALKRQGSLEVQALNVKNAYDVLNETIFQARDKCYEQGTLTETELNDFNQQYVEAFEGFKITFIAYLRSKSLIVD